MIRWDISISCCLPSFLSIEWNMHGNNQNMVRTFPKSPFVRRKNSGYFRNLNSVFDHIFKELPRGQEYEKVEIFDGKICIQEDDIICRYELRNTYQDSSKARCWAPFTLTAISMYEFCSIYLLDTVHIECTCNGHSYHKYLLLYLWAL